MRSEEEERGGGRRGEGEEVVGFVQWYYDSVSFVWMSLVIMLYHN